MKLCVYIYIYINIQKEREREGGIYILLKMYIAHAVFAFDYGTEIKEIINEETPTVVPAKK